VLTQTALYELDLDRHVARRHPGTAGALATQEAPPEAASLRRDHAPIPLLGVLFCRLGAPMILMLDARGDGIATVRVSTPVRHIRPLKPNIQAFEDNLADAAEPEPGVLEDGP
jgi:hypothetical protein